MHKQTRRLLIAAAAVLTVGLALNAPAPPGDPPQGAQPAERSYVAKREFAVRVPSALPERARIGEVRGEPFAARSFAPPAQSAARSAAPVALAVPYRFAGKMIREGKEELLLARGNNVFPVHEGELLDGAYRVQSIAPDRVTLLYVPLGRRVHVDVVSALNGAPLAAKPPGRAKGSARPETWRRAARTPRSVAVAQEKHAERLR